MRKEIIVGMEKTQDNMKYKEKKEKRKFYSNNIKETNNNYQYKKHNKMNHTLRIGPCKFIVTH